MKNFFRSCVSFTILLLLLLLLVQRVYSSDPMEILERVNRNLSMIRTVKAEVVQKVVMNGREYLYSGYYVAKWPGKVKVVYNYPEKYILWIGNDGSLYWYVPRLKVLYYFNEYTASTASNPSGIMPVVPGSDVNLSKLDMYRVTDFGESGFLFFKKYYYMKLVPGDTYRDFPVMEIYVYREYPVIRKVIGKRGKKTLFIEEMDDVFFQRGIYFPGYIKVDMKASKLVTETRYKKVILNQKVNDDEIYYVPPPGVKRVNLLKLLKK